MKQSTSRKGFLTQSSSLFSISTGVQLPFVGSHDSITKLQQSSHSIPSSYQPSSLFTDKHMRSVSKQMLDYTGEGLVFSSDVVKERSVSSLYPHRDVTDYSRSILPMPALTNSKKSSRRRNKKTTAQNPGNIPQRQQIIRPRHHRPTTKQINNVTETRWVKQKEGELIFFSFYFIMGSWVAEVVPLKLAATSFYWSSLTSTFSMPAGIFLLCFISCSF